jgi:serine/threonine-protein kinase
MVAEEGRLVGLMLLGGKKSEEPYSAADRQLLEAIAAQLAVVYENAALKRRVELEAKQRRDVLARLGERANLLKECPECRSCHDSSETVCPRDGRELVLALPIDRTVAGKYRLERRLGSGGMGAVYEATDLKLNRPVALKVLTARAFDSDRALRRFEREAQAAARLRHPNIVVVHDYGALEAEGAFLVMELLHGTTLRGEIDRAGNLSPATAALWFGQVLDAVQAAHGSGVIHRDLKPENVFVARDAGGASAKILDFGLAKFTMGDQADPRSLTVPGTVLGTLTYMSPEQLTGQPVDERSDLFSIGVMIAEALTGRHPFRAATTSAVMTRIMQGEYRIPGETAEIRALDAAVQRCLAKEPAARFASAADARDVLVRAIARCPPFPPPPPIAGENADTPLERTRRTLDLSTGERVDETPE